MAADTTNPRFGLPCHGALTHKLNPSVSQVYYYHYFSHAISGLAGKARAGGLDKILALAGFVPTAELCSVWTGEGARPHTSYADECG